MGLCLWWRGTQAAAEASCAVKGKPLARLGSSTDRTVTPGSQAQVSVADKDWQSRGSAGALCKLLPAPALCSAAHQKRTAAGGLRGARAAGEPGGSKARESFLQSFGRLAMPVWIPG